jgi:putative protease
VNVAVTATAGEPLRAVWTLDRRPDIAVAVASPEPLGAARNRAADAALIREQFERLGNTPYELGSLTFESKAEAFIPVSLLNQLRREAVEALAARQSEPSAILVQPAAACAEALLAAVRPLEREETAAPRVHLLVRTPEQLDAALALAPASITLDYLDLYGL